MSRIGETFARLRAEGRRGFVPFITAGDPDLATTRELIVGLARAGADVVELGVPFSVSLADVLRLVSEARAETDVPVVLFSYFNPLLQFGLERLCEESRRAGVDGVLVTDLAPEEAEEFSSSLSRRGLDMIFLVAPTSTDARLSMIAARASGFIYAVSRAGVTGARGDVSEAAERLVARVRAVSDLPVAVGFGISTREQVTEVWRYADAAVVGSALVAEIERHGAEPDLVARAGAFARSLLPEKS